ncbi:hypothetical protein [Loigolactobacillus rennini]|nr:hypothetical protein [Loigolactobacillus rennini]
MIKAFKVCLISSCSVIILSIFLMAMSFFNLVDIKVSTGFVFIGLALASTAWLFLLLDDLIKK